MAFGPFLCSYCMQQHWMQEQVLRVGAAVDDGVEFFIEQVFDFQSVGAYMLSNFTEPDA